MKLAILTRFQLRTPAEADVCNFGNVILFMPRRPPSPPVSFLRGVPHPVRTPRSGPGGWRFKSSLHDQSFLCVLSIVYVVFSVSSFSAFLSTFGTTEFL